MNESASESQPLLDSARPRVAIVGAGLAGISMAISLRKKLRYDNFSIYERAPNVGGTWNLTTYPGCGSDVPGHWYSLSTELNPYWSSYYVAQDELRSYWQGLFRKYNLEQHTSFNTDVSHAAWSESAQVWTLTLQDVHTKEQRQEQAEILIWATGILSTPAIPDITGLSTFRGEVWHSAEWRHDVPLKGKRVAVIGNGCSAAQFVPKISEDLTTEVFNIARTRQWYVPRLQYRYPQWAKWIFAYVPFAARIYRNWIMTRMDFWGHLLFNADNSRFIKATIARLTQYIKGTAPPALADELIPDFSPGCRRLILDPGYLDSLKRPNVTLVQDDVDCIEPAAIKLKSGSSLPVDHIILATGYDMSFLGTQVHGRGSVNLKEWFSSRGGPIAYLGIAAPGYPNFFLFDGPNTVTGHASVVFTAEVQIAYIAQLLRPMLGGRIKEIEVKDKPFEEYNAWLEKRMNHSAWTGCTSWYRAGKTGRNSSTFPGAVTKYWWLCRSVKWDHYAIGR